MKVNSLRRVLSRKISRKPPENPGALLKIFRTTRRHLSALLMLLLISLPVHAACDDTLLTLKLGTTTIHAEVAKTPAEREKGLMNRKALPKNWGMWFTFGGPSTAAFWMKDTYVPLDIIFVGRDMKIIHIHANARPLDLSLIASPLPYWYVLEVPAGFAKAHQLHIGDRITDLTPKC